MSEEISADKVLAAGVTFSSSSVTSAARSGWSAVAFCRIQDFSPYLSFWLKVDTVGRSIKNDPAAPDSGETTFFSSFKSICVDPAQAQSVTGAAMRRSLQ